MKSKYSLTISPANVSVTLTLMMILTLSTLAKQVGAFKCHVCSTDAGTNCNDFSTVDGTMTDCETEDSCLVVLDSTDQKVLTKNCTERKLTKSENFCQSQDQSNIMHCYCSGDFCNSKNYEDMKIPLNLILPANKLPTSILPHPTKTSSTHNNYTQTSSTHNNYTQTSSTHNNYTQTSSTHNNYTQTSSTHNNYAQTSSTHN
ncbi:hypothetical protein HELRODRAFT_182066 [Helobdella robusta]|uniref:Protein quiver n=1 Tax=Helobdella robusta TaxID=6412 RepID=T1FHP3_HELRO|nr:hypothetical protein HELRODRAFT_182066 [Helobdella robusta]ESN91885.1 hypothetical protein HELRODRAFT_182066 [Helobdella robusta]